MITRCRSSITAAAKSCDPRSNTTPPDCASCSPCCAAPASGGRDRTRRRTGRRHPARRRAHRRGDQPQPGPQPARPLRLGREQGRPVRRVRAGRHPAHRPRPAAPADPRHPGHGHLRQPAAPAKTSSPTGSGWPTSSARTCSSFPRRGRAVRRPRQPISLRFLTRFNSQDDADWLTVPAGDLAGRVGYTGRKDPRCCYRPAHRAPRGTAGAAAPPPPARSWPR